MSYRTFPSQTHKMKKFKLSKGMDLTLPQMAIYATLACYSDSNGISHIQRDTLAHLSGCKDLKTLSKNTNVLASKGLVKKNYSYEPHKRVCVYQITEPNNNFIVCTNELFNGDKFLIGFLCKLAEHRFKNTNWIGLSGNELANKMNISKPTFIKYKNLALQAGYIREVDNGIIISEELFPINVVTRLSDSRLNELNMILLQASKESKLYKQAKWYYDNYIYLQSDADHIYDKMISGLLNK